MDAGALTQGMAGVKTARQVALAAILCASLVAWPAARAVTLAPGGEWHVEQTGESCRLWRDFGSGAEQVRFNINAYGPDGSYRVTLTGRHLPRENGRAQTGEVAFNHGAAVPIILVVNQLDEEGMVSFLMHGPASAPILLRTYDATGPEYGLAPLPPEMGQITLSGMRMAPITLELGDTGQPLADLRACQHRLARSWGVSEAALADGASRPRMEDFAETFMRMAMPEAMVLNHVTVIAQMRVMVGADGTPQSCTVQSPTLERRQQRGLCNPLLNNGRYTPARDAAGNPVASVFRGVYTYFIFG